MIGERVAVIDQAFIGTHDAVSAEHCSIELVAGRGSHRLQERLRGRASNWAERDGCLSEAVVVKKYVVETNQSAEGVKGLCRKECWQPAQC